MMLVYRGQAIHVGIEPQAGTPAERYIPLDVSTPGRWTAGRVGWYGPIRVVTDTDGRLRQLTPGPPAAVSSTGAVLPQAATVAALTDPSLGIRPRGPRRDGPAGGEVARAARRLRDMSRVAP